MPDLIRYSPWQDVSQAASSIGGQLANGMLQRQQLLQQQQLAPIKGMQARAEYDLTRAQEGNQVAQTGFHNAQSVYSQAETAKVNQDVLINKNDLDLLQKMHDSANTNPQEAYALSIQLGKSNPQLSKLLAEQITMGKSGINEDPNLAKSYMFGNAAHLAPGTVDQFTGNKGIPPQIKLTPGQFAFEVGNPNPVASNPISEKTANILPQLVTAFGHIAASASTDQGIRLRAKQAYDKLLSLQNSFEQDGGLAPKPTTTITQLSPGTIENGYRFKGGMPSDPNSWEKVQ